jgi:hypothetical protein
MITDQRYPRLEVKGTQKRNAKQNQHEPLGLTHIRKQNTRLTNNKKLTGPLAPNALHDSQKEALLNMQQEIDSSTNSQRRTLLSAEKKKRTLTHQATSSHPRASRNPQPLHAPSTCQ